MTVLSDDERAVLAVLAAAGCPLSIDDAFEQLLPPRPSWPRFGGRRAYSARWVAMMNAWVGLGRAGMLAVWLDGSYQYEITEAGREALAGTKERA